jgi:hypothetical protein
MIRFLRHQMTKMLTKQMLQRQVQEERPVERKRPLRKIPSGTKIHTALNGIEGFFSGTQRKEESAVEDFFAMEFLRKTNNFQLTRVNHCPLPARPP